MVLLEMRILAVDLSDGQSSFFEGAFRFDDVAGSFSTGGVGNAAGGAIQPGGNGFGAGQMTFQVVSDNFAMRLHAMESQNKLCTLATPILLTANNEVSRLFVGREVPLNRSFNAGDTVTNQATTTTTAGSTGIEFRPVGTTVMITPSINSDRTVTLRVVQENSNVATKETVLVPTNRGFEPQEVNVVSSQTVTGTIVAKSELAVAFGGLVERSVVNRRGQVPLLGDVPLLGFFFRRVEQLDVRKEIVIVVRPYVLSTPAESEAISHRLLDKLGVASRATDVDGRVGDPDHRTWPNPSGRRIPFRFHGIEGDER
jgi:general secretion pathway protein D